VQAFADPDGSRDLAIDEAFERLYRKHVRDVYRYTLALLRNPADAEDITQATFLNAYRAYLRGVEPGRPRHWLIKIAHNACKSRHLRAARRPQEVPFEETIAAVPVAPDEAPKLEELLAALGHLPFNQRAALVMRELEGRSYVEIADTLEVSVSAVEALIFRARRALRRDRSLIGALSAVQLPPSLAGLFTGGSGAVAGGGVALGSGLLVKAAVLVAAGVVAGTVGKAVEVTVFRAPNHPAVTAVRGPQGPLLVQSRRSSRAVGLIGPLRRLGEGLAGGALAPADIRPTGSLDVYRWSKAGRSTSFVEDSAGAAATTQPSASSSSSSSTSSGSSPSTSVAPVTSVVSDVTSNPSAPTPSVPPVPSAPALPVETPAVPDLPTATVPPLPPLPPLPKVP
jgi:RNA polymerase sigma-70 factor, ECF subfamily